MCFIFQKATCFSFLKTMLSVSVRYKLESEIKNLVKMFYLMKACTALRIAD